MIRFVYNGNRVLIKLDLFDKFKMVVLNFGTNNNNGTAFS